MARALTTAISNQITAEDIKATFVFEINDTDYSSYLISWNSSFDAKFGAASAIFILNNNDERFSSSGSSEIKVGDTVELIEQFTGDSTEWKQFYGKVVQRSIEKRADSRTITLNCLDYISVLQNLDIDLEVEGTRVEVEDETLDPVYLDAPNDDMAQIFNFANDSIATKPLPLIRFRDQNHTDSVDTQYDGFEIYYNTGQMKLGSALNVKNNYEVLATYSYYIKGKYVEDVIEEILTESDGYDNFLFGESSAQDVIDDHLTTTFNAEEGTSTDTLNPNLASVTLIIETTLAGDVAAGGTSINIASTDGLPTSGSGSINGDAFTWSSIDSGNSLGGIPATGSNALKAHSSGDYVEYEASYSAGRVWYLSYSNLVTSLDTTDFTLPSGIIVSYHNRRGTEDGSYIILSTAISVAETVTCNTNYSFKTLQASDIELNRMVFRKREIQNSFEAINKVRLYLAPNYIIRTCGDDKIWASYLKQKTTADYTLNLTSNLNYLEDEDLYTRIMMWAKNKNPTNVMFGDDVDYTSDEEESYTGTATQTELSYLGEEKSGTLSEWANSQLSEAELLHSDFTQRFILDLQSKYIDKDYSSQNSTGYHVFSSPVSTVGKIILGDIVPTVYVNSVPIDNKVHEMVSMPVKVKTTAKTITEGGGKSKSVSVTTYYYYSVIFPHSSIVPSQPVYLYDSQGLLRHTLSANDSNMDYATGVWTIPGIERNDVAEILSTATYYVLYSTEKVIIDYENVVFKIHRSILPEPANVSVKATFEYWAIATTVRDINHVVDGRRDTQLQLEFFGEPAANFHLATIDLGESYNIQAIDIVGGFYKPDEHRKFDVGFKLSMQYSTDGTTFYAISDETENFRITSGEAISFEEGDLGTGFEARYLKFNLQDVDRIDFGRGRYIIAITEISVYSDIIIESEAKLIATTSLSANVGAGDTVISVPSTSGFTEPESGESSTAYIGTDSFTYTGLDSTVFTGCTVESGISGSSGDRVSQTLETDTTLYDDDSLLSQLGDRLFKRVLISDRNLFTQSELDVLAKKYLKEFYKNHSKIQVDIIYAPYLKVGQTVSLTDSYNNISDVKYFIESINDRMGFYSIILARYP